MRFGAWSLALVVLAGCRSKEAAPSPEKTAQGLATCAAGPVLDAKPASPQWVFDGHLDDGDWLTAAAPFTATDGGVASPHTELRAISTDAGLVLGVYGADEDEWPTDGVVVTLERANPAPPLVLSATIDGALACLPTCALPEGLTLKVDADGTIGDSRDEDEEWAMELLIPWRALGWSAAPKQLRLNATRTDTPQGQHPTTSWAPRCGRAEGTGVVRLRGG